MKKSFGIIFCILIVNFGFGQITKLRSTTFAYKTKINDYQWNNWSSWEASNVLISIFDSDDRIVIYSEELQTYDLIKDEGKSVDSDGDVTLSLLCIDNEGLRCRVRLVVLNSENGRMQFYVDYDNIKWVYNVYLLE